MLEGSVSACFTSEGEAPAGGDNDGPEGQTLDKRGQRAIKLY